MTAWATIADVSNLTGKTVTDEIIAQAQGIIETTSAARPAVFNPDTTSAGDLDWLRRAVAYEAGWVESHPDLFDRDDVSAFSQDGLSATLKPDGLVLAPMARRCLKKLSWVGTRTEEVGLPTQLQPFYTSDDVDDSLPWQPMNR